MALDVKEYQGRQGTLDLAGRARGHLESWRKWSFPVEPLRRDGGDLGGWVPVRKRRRISRFSPASRPVATQPPERDQEPRCAAELTEIHALSHDWWTLGFEATGPHELLRSALQASAELVFAQAVPAGVAPGPAESSSYREWLYQRCGSKVMPTSDDCRVAVMRERSTA